MVSDATIQLIVTSLTSLVLAWIIRKQGVKVDKIHKEVNGHMSEYLKATKELGEKVGKEEGRAEVKAEVKEEKAEAKADAKEIKPE